jgi:hypothetical protein
MSDTGVKVSGHIRPLSLADKYATHLENYGRGGIHHVSNREERDNISSQRRSEGMQVVELDTYTVFTLKDGIENQNWRFLYKINDDSTDIKIALTEDYILEGDKDDIAEATPALIDVKLDILDIHDDIDRLKAYDEYLVKRPMPLEENKVLVGNIDKIAEARDHFDIQHLPHLEVTDVVNVLTEEKIGKIFVGKETENGETETVQSSILSEFYVDLLNVNKQLETGTFIVNTAMKGGLAKAQALDKLSKGGLLKTSEDGKGRLESVAFQEHEMIFGKADHTFETRKKLHIDNLPSLTKGKFWQGDEENNAKEVALKIPSSEDTFIVQKEHSDLPNAQALSGLSTGLLKNTTATGVLSIATDVDYVKPATLEEEVAELETQIAELETQIADSLVEANAFASSAAFAAELAAHIKLDWEMLPFFPIPGLTYGTQIMTAIGAGTAAASSIATGAAIAASSAMSAVEDLELEMTGNVIAKGEIKDNKINAVVVHEILNKDDLYKMKNLGEMGFIRSLN